MSVRRSPPLLVAAALLLAGCSQRSSDGPIPSVPLARADSIDGPSAAA